MSRGITLSNIATLELESIRDYIAADNPQAADRVLDRIWDALESIATLPGSGRLHPDFTGLRYFPAGKYVIYYRLQNEIIWVQRILHGARNTQGLI